MESEANFRSRLEIGANFRNRGDLGAKNFDYRYSRVILLEQNSGTNRVRHKIQRALVGLPGNLSFYRRILKIT